MRAQAGFSLLELIIAMIIVLVLSAAAYPSYLNLIQHSRRAEARSALHATMLLEERYYTLHNTYFAFDHNTANSPFKWWSGDAGATSYYEIRAGSCPDKTLGECVLLTAIPGTVNVRSHADPVCGNLMLDSANNKTCSLCTENNSSCW